MTAIAACSRSPAGRARIYTRTGLDWTDKFPEIAEAARRAAVRQRAARRRDRRARREGQYRLLGAAGGDQGRRARADPVPVRRARDRRREAREAAQSRAQATARRPARRRRAALHPLCRPYRRQGRAIVRGDVRGRPGRDHLEEGRRALSPRADQELAQDQMHAAAGVRDPRLDARATRGGAASARCCSG